jgi:hypothetical protein
MAAKTKVSTDQELIDKAKKTTPWLVPLLTDPQHGKTYLQWARDAEAGNPPTAEQVRAATYNWDITQVWSANQASLFNLSLTNPGEYKKQQEATVAAIDKYITQSGNPVTPEIRQELINDVFLKGWAPTDPRIPQIVAGTYDITKAKTGTALSATDQVKGLASSYMVPVNDAVVGQWAQAIQAGTKTVADAQKYFKDQAAGLYPFMAGTIDVVDPSTWFSPAKNLISQNLGINENLIDFNDPSGKWMNAVTTRDPKTGAMVARTNADVIKEVRTNPIYGYDTTPGAISAAKDLGRQLKAMMGFGE